MHETTTKRSGWIWIISIFYGLSAVWTCISWYIVVYRQRYVTAEVKSYLGGLTAWDYMLTIAQALLSLSAALALFFMRKAAYRLFLAALVVFAISGAWHILAKGWLTAMNSMRGALFGAFAGLALLVAVCFYTHRLSKQGRLR